MVFNSLPFALFFALTAALVAATPGRYRWVPLLGASYYFYMCWRVEHLLVLMGATLVTYLAALGIQRATSQTAKKLYLGVCLGADIGTLFFYKYFDFFMRSLNDVLASWNLLLNLPLFKLLLPIGLSFYTFQLVAYAVDVFRGGVPAQTHLGRFALFVSFWPQILAGPIGRAGELMPQFKRAPGFDERRVVHGLRLMLWGVFKKVVIADHLALYVDQVYAHLQTYHGLPLTVAAIFYTIQIYCDFSGYTDLARGAAQVMGFDLMENFRRPYFAKSMREFWQRWHISLSTWFRDYVYIPLGGRRVAPWRWYANLMLTFILSGLWHGANWTFVIWGAMHGACLVLEYMTGGFQQRLADGLIKDPNSRWHPAIQAAITFALICLAWVFFRSQSTADALYWISHMFWLTAGQTGVAVTGAAAFIWSILLIVLLLAVELKQRQIPLTAYLERWPVAARWSVYTVVLWAVVIGTVFGVRQEFIYFQF
jgi:D-alanyl-lipoteichoic acid acyltransferase DltB (MBOAT superfamily)